MPFRDVVGHRPLLRVIARAVREGSLPPSTIFAGPDGVGKRLVAGSLAQVLNCEATVQASADTDGLVVDACGACAACRRIERGLFADVLAVNPGETGSITIEPVRAAIDQAAYRPFEGRWRVVIIDEADRLVPPAQNALLKTLEEPATRSAFVLVSSRPDALLPTVRSRCPQLHFGRLVASDVVDVLVNRHGYEQRAAQAATAASEGSIGRALEVSSGAFTAARDAAANLLRVAASARDPRGRLEGAKELVASKGGGRPAQVRDELTLRLHTLSSLLRDLELVAVRADDRWLGNADLKPGLVALAKAYDSDRREHAFVAVGRALGAIEQNASPKVVADWLACQL